MDYFSGYCARLNKRNELKCNEEAMVINVYKIEFLFSLNLNTDIFTSLLFVMILG